MGDFSNPNICGASPELNDVMSKITAAKADAKAKLDESASTAAAAFDEAQNELISLKDKLQSIEIPTIPKLNLQSEIKSLVSQSPGTPSFFSALAKIKTEFEDDIKGAGFELDSLVTKATESISGGGDVCAIVPNFEKESGSTEPAVQKPIAPKQAVEKAVVEISSKVWQNPDVEAKVAENSAKVASYATTNILPVVENSIFKFVPSNLIKTLSVGGNSPPMTVAVPPTKATERKNLIVDKKVSGFSYKKSRISEIFTITSDTYGSNNTPAKKLEIVDGQCQLKLKHKPSGGLVAVWVHTGNNAFKYYLDSSECINLGLVDSDGKPIPSTDANGQFYYKNYSGPHRGLLIYSPRYENPKTNFNTMFAPTFIFTPPFALTEHPGNINSGGTYVSTDPDHFYRGGQESLMAGSGFTVPSTVLSDSKLNNIYKNFAVKIRYEYMEKYDPDYVAAPTVAT
tara:strand:+ start:2625 stop:3992 length:1368 start_codon:yes stop_codon:yes gene_type:complete